MQLMRWFRAAVVSTVVVASTVAPARADGALEMRAVYYKERATRVEQPMLDARSDVGDHGELNAHVAVDVITSASVAAGADANAFTEKRYEGGAGYAHQLGRYKISGQGKYSTESDYVSKYFGGGVAVDLFEKNTQLALGAGQSRDAISNAGAQSPFATPITGNMTSSSGFLSVNQLLSPHALLGLSADLAYIKGFQQNPYRLAISDQGLVPERHPEKRLRQAYALTARYFIDRTATTLIATYRYYRDDWKVVAHTPELRLVQEVGGTVEASLRFRYHRQSAAYFYQDRYAVSDPAMQPFVTDDVKLSAFSTATMEAKLSVAGETFGLDGRWGAARLEGLVQYAVQRNRFGNAAVAHVALIVPFGGSY
jgi:hypothetical protein